MTTGRRARVLFAVSAVLALCVASYAQRPYVPYRVMLHATISRKTGFATVRTASAQPLSMAVQAVAQEYGWVVDFEDPPYAGTDLSIHPSLKPGTRPYTVVAGGPFQSTYRETPDLSTSRTAEQGVLQKIVSDYNRSGNPGQFKVLSLPDGNFDVVGIATRDNAGDLVPVKPLLNTLITVPEEPRTRYATLEAIANALQIKAMIFLGPSGVERGVPISSAQLPTPTIVVGGTHVPARDLLTDVADADGGRVADNFGLTYEPPGLTPGSGPRWLLSVSPAYRAEYDMFGSRTLVPILKGRQ